MAHHRQDVLDHAVGLLDAHGLAALTMRRLGSELGVRPSAIYHHFESKQALLAAVADELLAGRPPATAGEWPERLIEVCAGLREAMLRCTDGADVVATVWAFGMGARAPAAELEVILREEAGLSDELVQVASRALLHYAFGHAFEEQTARQAVRLGAVDRSLDSLPDFDLGLQLVIDGLRSRIGDRTQLPR